MKRLLIVALLLAGCTDAQVGILADAIKQRNGIQPASATASPSPTPTPSLTPTPAPAPSVQTGTLSLKTYDAGDFEMQIPSTWIQVTKDRSRTDGDTTRAFFASSVSEGNSASTIEIVAGQITTPFDPVTLSTSFAQKYVNGGGNIIRTYTNVAGIVNGFANSDTSGGIPSVTAHFFFGRPGIAYHVTFYTTVTGGLSPDNVDQIAKTFKVK